MLTREGIVRLLEEAGVEVVAQAEDAAMLIRHVRLERPDAAIVDIRMPPTHTDEGLVAAQQIRAEHPDIGVLVLSHYVEPSYAIRLLEEHPERIGYLLKERVFDVATERPWSTRRSSPALLVEGVARIPWPSSLRASGRCSGWSRRGSRTARSPPVSSSPSGRWKPT